MWNHRLCYFYLNLNTIKNVYFKLWQDIHIVNEKYKQFLTFLRWNIILITINNTILIINVMKMLHEICEKDSLIDYYYLTVWIILYMMRYMANKYVKLKKDIILKLFFPVYPSKITKLCFFLFLFEIIWYEDDYKMIL